MVRIKNRYLLVNILYPELEKNSSSKDKLPDVVLFNQPTVDALNARALLRGIQMEVANLFGDYGSGAIADSIAGLFFLLLHTFHDEEQFLWMGANKIGMQ
ncbi:hypothetical protein EYC80_001669 [Monilinia laxa]|uniref:Uncharacterized protein n=1 Tax=Monilinia laxa TaxID=61186 RepID=A0A5N6K6E5_MONLA|nr:hypothetical protein EYC80_001669 [Monilinia laxa]